MSDRHTSEEAARVALEERLDFERFVADLSGQFLNVPARQVSETIRNGLRHICERLDLDRSTLYRIGPDGLVFDPVGWEREGVRATSVSTGAKELSPWTIERVTSGEVVSCSTLDDIPHEADRAALQAAGTKSMVALPLSAAGQVVGAVGFSSARAERTWPPEVIHRLTLIASVLGQVLARQIRDEAVASAAEEAQRLKDRLQVENVYLRQEVRERLRPATIVGQSAAVRRVLDQIEQVAATDSTVLLIGETGTGKELFATQIHELGARRTQPMVRVNCAAIPETLIESELFGREKGAFTGALARQVGRFELAHRSTIFLDEIGDLPPDVQVKLLRVLEERHIERLGSRDRLPWIRGSSQPPIAIWSSEFRRARFGRISITA
jgi:transcriptional regulator with GAF, ATPase, and Fis domain